MAALPAAGLPAGVERFPVIQLSGKMRTTIGLPDQLMTEVKVLAAREGCKLGQLMAERVRAGLEQHTGAAGQAGQPPSAERWLAEWLKMAEEVMREAPDEPTGRELLEEERSRLEPR